MNQSALHPFSRVMGWLLPALVVLTPMVIVYTLVLPPIGQAYFFKISTLAAAVGVGVAWAAGWWSLPRRLTLTGWLALALGVAVVASLPASQSPLFSLKRAMLPGCGLIFLGMILFFPRRRLLLERLRLALIAIGGLLALYGILQHFGLEFLRYSDQIQKNKVMATIGHPNYLASVLGPTLFLVISLFPSRRPLGVKIAAGVLVFLILFCVALAETRGVWLGLACGVVAVAVLGTRYCLRHGVGLRWVQSFAIGLALALLALTAVNFYVLPRFHASINVKKRLESNIEVKSRFYYWRTAIDMARQRPFFGQGYAMFDPLFWKFTLEQQKGENGPFYYDMLHSISGRVPEHVHNEYLEVLAEQGFVGVIVLAALLSFFTYFGVLAIMREPSASLALQHVAVYGAFVVMLVDAAFSFPWRLPVSLIVFMIVLAWLHEAIYPQATPEGQVSQIVQP